MKTAVVIYNLGGPCCNRGIQPFLFNLFNDPAIISLPNPFRGWLAKFISSRRMEKATKIYNKIGGGSPILQETYDQASALQKELDKSGDYKVFVYMRYSYPEITDVVDAVNLYNPDRIITLPLYPQYSTTTTTSSIKQWDEYTGGNKTVHIQSYETHPDFVNAYKDLLLVEYEKVKDKNPVILFSAHGIPQNRVDKGDPYEKHVNASSNAIIEAAGLKSVEHVVCYQSKVGPLKWLTPATDKVIEQYAKDDRAIILLPVSFVSEHSETLVELDMDYKDMALELGAASYNRVPTVRTNKEYIKCLKDLALKA
jgi:protoporphyrin/coproporphyrin ferrochelatase